MEIMCTLFICCFFSRCRHSVFTDYFGDETPECIDKCDCCVNPKAVQKKIDHYQVASVRSRTSIRSAKYDDDGDLYGGGRGGQQKCVQVMWVFILTKQINCRETEEYSATGERSNEKTAQFASNSLIQKQFALRKSSQNSYDSQDSEEVRNSRVKSANTTARKVNGLTVKVIILLLFIINSAEFKLNTFIVYISCGSHTLV
jgi:ATP-dependent DNA helicase Q5